MHHCDTATRHGNGNGVRCFTPLSKVAVSDAASLAQLTRATGACGPRAVVGDLSCDVMVLHTIFQRLPVSENVKVVLGCSLIFGISGYWTFKRNGSGYDNMQEKNESMRKQRGSGASPFSS